MYIGFMMYKVYTLEDGKCFILDFCIEPDYRQKGIGSRIFHAFETYVKEKEGATYFELNTSNEDNKRFWIQKVFLSDKADDYGKLVYIKK